MPSCRAVGTPPRLCRMQHKSCCRAHVVVSSIPCCKKWNAIRRGWICGTLRNCVGQTCDGQLLSAAQTVRARWAMFTVAYD